MSKFLDKIKHAMANSKPKSKRSSKETCPGCTTPAVYKNLPLFQVAGRTRGTMEVNTIPIISAHRVMSSIVPTTMEQDLGAMGSSRDLAPMALVTMAPIPA